MRISDLSSDVCSSDLPGLAAAEAIARRLRLAIRQPEGAFGHDPVQIAGHRADRAVAVQHFDICRGKIGLEMDEAAMAAAADRDRHYILLLAKPLRAASGEALCRGLTPIFQQFWTLRPQWVTGVSSQPHTPP